MKPHYLTQLFSCFLVVNLSLAGFHLFAQQRELSVGDITFDSKIDDPKFQFCNPDFVLQGYELKMSSDEGNVWICSQLKQKFVPQVSWSNQTGFITVRFAINCLGLTDRFRAMGVSAQLQPSEFSTDLTLYLTKLVKAIKWPVQTYRMKSVDYYQDVTFKIKNGQLTEVIL